MAIKDRKSLKKPDEFLKLLNEFFGKLSQNSRQLTIVLAGGVVLLGGTAFYLHEKEETLHEGSNALFLARTTLEEESNALKERFKEESPVKPAAKNKKAKADSNESPLEPVVVDYKKVDVASTFPKTLESLKKVVDEYSGTRPAFEASVELGRLHFDHGDPNQSITWFEKATQDAPGAFEKTLAMTSLGYAQEGAGQLNEAFKTFEKALAMNEKSTQGDLLLSMGRVQEALGKKEEAKKYYDQVVEQLPNTSASRKAETYREMLN